jgi:protein phosphatase
VNWEDIILDAAATDTGMRRANNQDSYSTVRAPNPETWRNRGHLFLVADGMGAHAVGELASKMACDLIPHTYMKSKKEEPEIAISKAFREVSTRIHSRALANRDFKGMGTTCSSLLLLPEGALIAHVGDSRVYRVREERIDQLSFDHSLVWELVRRNHLTSEQANLSVPKNVITRSLGPEATIEVDLEGPLPVQEQDVYVLCSDGLSGPVTDEEIGAIASNFHPKDACKYLVSLANLRGGLDNITVVVVRIGNWNDPDAPPDEVEVASSAKPAVNGTKPVDWRSRFKGLINGRLRSQPPPPAETKGPYRTAACAIRADLIERFVELSRQVQELAVNQAWGLDWIEIGRLRRLVAESMEHDDKWKALRHVCELFVILGTGARFHRKTSGSSEAV